MLPRRLCRQGKRRAAAASTQPLPTESGLTATKSQLQQGKGLQRLTCLCATGRIMATGLQHSRPRRGLGGRNGSRLRPPLADWPGPAIGLWLHTTIDCLVGYMCSCPSVQLIVKETQVASSCSPCWLICHAGCPFSKGPQAPLNRPAAYTSEQFVSRSNSLVVR